MLWMWYIYAILAAVTRWMVYTILQKVLDKVSPVVYILLNAIFSGIVAAIILSMKWTLRSSIKQLDPYTIKYMLLTVILMFIANIFIYISIQRLWSSKAAVFEIMYPLFVIIFSIFLYNQWVTIYFIVWALLIFIGSAIIVKFA